MFEVIVSGKFTAAHQLPTPNGGFEPLHEHVWGVRVTYAGPGLNEDGLLVDFGVVRANLTDVLRTLEAQNLGCSSVLAGRTPSAENVARHIAQHLPAMLGARARLHCVEVEEEPGCRARYSPPNSLST